MKRSGVETAQHLLAQAADGDDPWLISYADLVTNLLAFMVLLVSMAGISFDSVEQLPEVFDGRRDRPLAELEGQIARLAEQEGLGGRVAADVDPEGLAIRLEDAILFPSGVAGLTSTGQGLVKKVADLLRGLPSRFTVTVEGHTDDVPIATPRFGSNWELSAARALAVRDVLESSGIPAARLAIAAFADTRPPQGFAPEVSVEARRQQARRVVIRVGR